MMRKLIVVDPDSLVIGQVRRAEYIGNPSIPKVGEEVQLVAGDMNWTPLGKANILTVDTARKGFVVYECEVVDLYVRYKVSKGTDDGNQQDRMD